MAAQALLQQAAEEAAPTDTGNKKRKILPSVLGDDRFKAMFEDPSFAVDEAAEEYKFHHPNAGMADSSFCHPGFDVMCVFQQDSSFAVCEAAQGCSIAQMLLLMQYRGVMVSRRRLRAPPLYCQLRFFNRSFRTKTCQASTTLMDIERRESPCLGPEGQVGINGCLITA